MRPDSNPDRPRSGTLILALFLLAAGVVVVGAMFRAGGGSPTTPAPQDRAAEGGAASEVALDYQVVPEVVRFDAASSEPASGDSRVLVRCLQRATGSPLADVRLYRMDAPIAGPSDDGGTLEILGATAGSLTLWAEGWLPVTVRGESLPPEVAFDRPKGSLEVRLLNATPEHRLLRSLLQPRTPNSLPGGPWSPTLVERAVDLHVAEGIPAGSYDVYLWMIIPGGEARPFSGQGVEVSGEGWTRLSFDLAAPQDPDDLESDG